MSRVIVAAIALLSVGLVTTAQAADRSEDLAYGKDRYDRYCAPCHNKGYWAAQKLGARLGEDSAVLEDRTDLNVPYVETVVRVGIGSMPPYRKTEVSPEELDAIANYLTRKER